MYGTNSIVSAATAGQCDFDNLIAIRDGIIARNHDRFAGYTMVDSGADGGSEGQGGSGDSRNAGSGAGAGGAGGQIGSGSEGSGTGAKSGTGDDKDDDEPLGPGGKKALQAERDGRKQLEQQLQQLQQSQKDQMAALAKAFGFEPDKKASTDDLVSQLQQQVAEMTHNADVDRIARDHNISDPDDIKLLRSAKDSELMEQLAKRLKSAGQQQQNGTPRPDRSVGRGSGDDKGATSTVSSGRDLFRDRHKKN
ncbi:hypothetical protein [Auraticoccus monumenti]|uniref:Scaffolding protein n=1 Tax=Auraticoccus monumenti TaxID=675864 RepID=A0A1G6ULA8_9ACTN|nr:hypothetical protein [Auraticoccus monumenti]SDD41325.1 hypothetical protein SAMN04489747_0898 [Auraticoccus monumenti]